jgi:hypothetical protein
LFEIDYKCAYRDVWYFSHAEGDLNLAQIAAVRIASERGTSAVVIDEWGEVVFRFDS